MPQVLYETPTNRVIQQDDGTVVVVPASLGLAPAPAAAALPAAEPAAPAPLVVPPGLGAPIVNPGPLPLRPPKQPEPAAPAAAAAPAPAAAPSTPPTAAPALPSPAGAAAGEAGAFEKQQAAIDEASALAAAKANELKKISEQRQAAAADLEQKRLAQEKADRDRGIELEQKYTDAVDASNRFNATPADKWGGISTSRKAIALIGVALSGLGAGLMRQQGNPALDILEAEFSRNIQQHMAQGQALERRASQQATIADRFNAMAQSRQGQFQLRLANAWKGFEDQVATTMAKYTAPEVIANGKLLLAQVQQKKAEAISRATESQQRYEQEERHFTVSTALQRSGLGLQAAGLKQADEHFEQDLKLRKDAMLLDAARLEQTGRAAEAKAMKEQANALVKGAIGGAPVFLGYDKNGQPLIRKDPLLQADGSVFTIPDEIVARKVKDQKAGVDYSVKLIDDITRLVHDHGWSSDLLRSDEWQKVQQRYNALILNEKERANLGAALTENELNILQRSLGMKDPTAMERLGDPTTGLRAARQSVLDRFNATLDANLYTGQKYDIPEMTPMGVEERTQKTPVGELGSAAVTRSNIAPWSPEAASQFPEAAAATERIKAGGPEAARAEPPIPDVLQKVSVSQRQAIFALAQTARAGDTNARATLEVLAADKDPNISAAARLIAAASGVPLQGLQ